MPTARVSKKATVYSATINAGPGQWTEICDLRDITTGEPLSKPTDDDILDYSEPITFDVAWKADDAGMRDMLSSVYGTPTFKVQYKPCRYWFSPTLILDKAWLDQFRTEEHENSITAWVDIKAGECDVQWPNRWAKPVYWLWRQWTKTKRLAGKFWAFLTER